MAITTLALEIVRNTSMDSSEDHFSEEFWEVIDRYRGELINQAMAILGDLADAEDVVQESFCEAFRNRDKLKEQAAIGAWLRTVNRANALNRWRGRYRERKNKNRKQRERPDRALTTGGFSGVDRCEFVAKAIEKLPAELRRVVVLHCWENMSYEEVAERLGISARTVRRLFHDALMKLYQTLGPDMTGLFTPTGGENSARPEK